MTFTLQATNGQKQFRFIAHNAQDSEDSQAIEIQTWESFPKRPEQFRFAARHFHFVGNARNCYRSLINQGWIAV
jgi:hypothetical protein